MVDVFRRLTLPALAPVLLLLLLRDDDLRLPGELRPGPRRLGRRSARVRHDLPPALFVYRNGFEYLRYGYAAAATLVVFALTALIVLVQWQIVRRWRRGFELG